MSKFDPLLAAQIDCPINEDVYEKKNCYSDAAENCEIPQIAISKYVKVLHI